MIEFKYDEKTYIKMSLRIGWWVYAVIFGIVGILFVYFGTTIISDYFQGKREFFDTMVSIGLCLVLGAVLVAVFFVSIRKQLAKSFAIYSADGVVCQKAEVTDEELIIYNVSRQSITRMNRRDITAVKSYKKFFVVVTNTKVKWAVPFDEQTQLLYDVLTGRANISVLPAKSEEIEGETDFVEEKSAEQPEMNMQSDALSFEYELTEQQAISMLTKVLTVRFRMFLVAIVIFSILTVGYIVALLVNYFAFNKISLSQVIFACLFAILTALGAVTYGKKNKSGRVNGSNYFQQQAKDGQCIQIIQLYDQGIVVVNKLRDTHVYFRITDMEKISLFTDFFIVELKSKEILPIPLTESTQTLYDILKNGISHNNVKNGNRI